MPSIVQASAANSIVTADAAIDTNATGAVTVIVRDGSSNPIAGIGPAGVVLSVSGTGNTLTQPTGQTTTAGVAPGVAFESSVAEAKTVTITVGGLALSTTPSVTVGSPASADFQSDWGTATGSAHSGALDDGGLWPSVSGADPSTTLAVVAASGATLQNGGGSLAAAGWPTTNALRSTMLASSFRVFIPSTDTTLSALAVGSTRHYAQYFVQDIPDAVGVLGDGPEHGTSNDSTSGDSPIWQWSVSNAADGTFAMALRDVSGLTAYPWNRFNSPTLTKGVVYRRLWAFERVSSTTYRIPYVRIRNSAGTLLYDGDDFIRSDGPDSLTTYFASGVWGIPAGDTDTAFRSFQTGSNGPFGWPSSGTPYFYFGRTQIADAGPLDGGA